MKITFTQEYKGGYAVRVDGFVVGYIDRSYTSGWTYKGRLFGYIAEAKAAALAELTNTN